MADEPREAPRISSADREARVAEYWQRADVPRKLAAGTPSGPPFRFTEGPPTANGAPHLGHLVARTLKDVELRYRRQRGHRIVTPMAGWDCHGLPVELEIEKRHGMHAKREIEEYGIARFSQECRQSALEVASVWVEMSRRLGYWLDYEHPYYTMSAPYIESVWWSLKTLHGKGLLEPGHYVQPYCPRCETPLSSHEVAQGYREATDPSVTVRFPISPLADGRRRSVLVWTTTPWTLPSNLLVAARLDLRYVGVASSDGEELILAESAKARYFPDAAVLHEYTGQELAGATYTPPFSFPGPGPGRYRIVLDDSVDAAEGTGFVHIAPSFGPEDQRIGAREGVGVYDPLDGRAHFTEAVPLVKGKGFKLADPILVEHLRERGLLLRAETIKHTYPFCWRCQNPLIYRAIDAWFVRTSRKAARLVELNQTVRWNPEHLRDGRFGNFLTEAKDWALSRNRYWGTPLPIWRCSAGHTVCIGSFAELGERLGHPLLPDFDPHRTGVDSLTWACSECQAPMHREPYTIDGWYDSGAAPFAQYHYPFEPGPFDPAEPLDYIAEGLDQTRGWFYTLLVLSTLLFDRAAYRTSLTNGLVLDSSGQKMSKSRGNALDPLGLLAEHGGDSLRWIFLVRDYTEPMRVDAARIAPTAQRTLGTLRNVVAFFQENATADGLAPQVTPPRPTGLLDRWLLARLSRTVDVVTASLEEYDPRRGALALEEFVGDLSTWYLRRSRPRFWGETTAADRAEAHATLSYTLRALAQLLAPFTPFLAEEIFQEVGGGRFATNAPSVHAAGWPSAGTGADVPLEEAMASLRAWVEVGREQRQRARVKARVPLSTWSLQPKESDMVHSLGGEGESLLADEMNVSELRWLAPGGAAPEPEADWVAAPTPRGTAYLYRIPSPEQLREGLVRDVLRRLQNARREAHLQYTDRIRLTLWAEAPIAEALRTAEERIRRDLLVDTLQIEVGSAPDGLEVQRWQGEDGTLSARIERVP
ncbi:MAG: isoleucine--tRNA ligase [Thermoplasmata archaeon]|nr:isoleucine--tRNA ligase [Thermoplasmata archaeon]